MKLTYAGLVATALTALSLSPAHAASCDVSKPGDELTPAEAQSVYECLADKMHAGYKKGSKRWIPAEYVNDYKGWTLASSAPAAPGFHGGRFLMTWVNDTGAAEYMKYAENPSIPVGTVIAKESFSVTDAGKARRGPLFIMEKVAAGSSPKTDDWYYMMVSPGGKPQAVEVVSGCHECHSGFEAQGNLGYPVEEVRITN